MNGIATEREAVTVPVAPPGVMRKLEAARQEFARFQFWLRLARMLLVAILAYSALVFADWMWVLPTAVRGLGPWRSVPGNSCPLTRSAADRSSGSGGRR